MADKSKRRLRKPESVRDRARKAESKTKPRRLVRAARGVHRPIKAAVNFGRAEMYLPMPDNRAGRFLNKRRYFTPRYFREAWQELRQVTWPTRKETWKLTLAVFVFATLFGLLIAVTDYGLDKLFKEVLL